MSGQGSGGASHSKPAEGGPALLTVPGKSAEAGKGN